MAQEEKSNQKDMEKENSHEGSENEKKLDNSMKKKKDSTNLPLFQPNDLLKVPLRFNIMFLLFNYNQMGFTELHKLLKCTPGNLDHHLKKLLAAGWIEDRVAFSPRPLKFLRITPLGQENIRSQIQQLKTLLRNSKKDH
ncbi:MAG: transcriptional regulator [Promethearchaeota archaeon]